MCVCVCGFSESEKCVFMLSCCCTRVLLVQRLVCNNVYVNEETNR